MSNIRLYPSGQEVTCESGDTVLSALEKAGYAIPNNCRAGACGECKIKVLKGEYDQGFIMDMALSQEERAEGYGLMCMAKPTGEELEIEWGTDDAQPKLFPPKENIYFQVVDRVQRTPRIIELRLRPLGAPMRFWPGQFVMVGDERNGIPMRSYSIANIPNADGEICLMITKVDEGMTSGWIHENLQPGTRVMINGPYGTFIGDPSVDKPVMCMAAGSGLAPILSLTGAALARGYKAPVTLIFSAQHQEDMMYRGLLEFWASKYRNFKWYCTYTQDDSAELRGRIPTILKDISQDLSEHGVYIAGGPGFVEDCSAKAMALGADKDQIHTEGFFDQFVPERPPKERLMG